MLLSLSILALASSTGCMVLDEIDSAQSKMNAAPKPKAAAEDSTSVAAKALKTKNELLQQSKEWWNEATSLSPADKDSGIVTCRTQSGTQFMSKSDCLTRGGIPQSVSG